MLPSAGDMIARIDQPFGSLLFSLLEPRSDDGFATRGFLADRLEAGAVSRFTGAERLNERTKFAGSEEFCRPIMKRAGRKEP
ncbi:MAG: hypothetical protein J4G03_02095 [Gemmatimonadetes bacterium]|nr:hypothetical protein [Gemmatimonadota bacterium]